MRQGVGHVASYSLFQSPLTKHVTTSLPLLFLLAAGTCFAWDPSGTWSYEANPNSIMEVSCQGDSCTLKWQGGSGKYKAVCLLAGEQMVCAYSYQTSSDTGFVQLEQQSQNTMRATYYGRCSEQWVAPLLVRR